MVTPSHMVEIRDGTITLPEDMFEQGSIGTADGMVVVALRASGEIVVRANAPTPQLVPVSPALAAIREYAKNLPPSDLEMQDDDWDEAIAQGIANHCRRSMKDTDGGG